MTDDPARGVAILTDLYLDTNDPTFIYNHLGIPNLPKDDGRAEVAVNVGGKISDIGQAFDAAIGGKRNVREAIAIEVSGG